MDQTRNETETIKEFDVVALLADAPEHNLRRGQVGTVVHGLDKDNVLVEFTDSTGGAYAIEPFAKSQLLPLIHESQAA